MQDRPTARELVEAAAQFLSAELLPAVADPRLRFRSLIAANVLAIVARELAAGAAPLRDELRRVGDLLGVDGDDRVSVEALEAELLRLRRALCTQIRQGQLDDQAAFARVLRYGRDSAIARLRIANPRYLERVLPAPQGQGG
jgi:hypothetical protein